MFETIDENLKVNITFYTIYEVVEVFRNTHSGLKDDCEHCKDYPIVSSITDYTRQAFYNLFMFWMRKTRGVPGRKKTATFTKFDIFYAFNSIRKTLALFEQVPSYLSVMDLTDQR